MDPELLTEDHFRKFTLYQKIEGSIEALLTMLRKDFFNTLEGEIQELGMLDIPTLIIWGREDASLPLRSGEDIKRVIAGSRLEILDAAGHLANFDRADALNRLVSNFFMN
jgi:pimeloyl-ACP methyl ester carboxylesterase